MLTPFGCFGVAGDDDDRGGERDEEEAEGTVDGGLDESASGPEAAPAGKPPLTPLDSSVWSRV